MPSLIKSKIRPTSAVSDRTANCRASHYAFLTLGVFVLSFIGWASDVQPVAAQDIGGMIGGVIGGGGLRFPDTRERHREHRRSRDNDNESNAKDDKTSVGDGKTFGSKGDEDTRVMTTKVGDGGSPKGQSSGPDGGRRSGDPESGRRSGDNDKGPPPSEKPQGEGPDFTAR